VSLGPDIDGSAQAADAAKTSANDAARIKESAT
jgi:hypothetical protein